LQRLVDRAKAEADRARLLDEVLDVLADPAIPDEQAGRLVRERIGMARLIAARRPVEDREPRDHGHFDLLAAATSTCAPSPRRSSRRCH